MVERAKKPKAPRRSTYHHGNVREELMEAALAMMVERGSDAFTLREAARRIGVDHRAAYRHFEDKDAVLAAIAIKANGDLLASVRRSLERLASSDPRDRLRVTMRAYVVHAFENPVAYRVMTGPRVNEDGRFPDLDVQLTGAFVFLKREFEEGMKLGVLRKSNVEHAAIAFWSQMHGFASLVLMRRIRIRKEQLPAFTDAVFESFLEGVSRSSRNGSRKPSA